jgi:hypothetical protein
VTVFFQHVGERGGGRDFPRTIGTPEASLVRFTFGDVAQHLEHLEPPERERLAAETALQAPDGFQIWGIPSGARSVLSSLAPGDYLLLLESPGPGGIFVYGGRIIAGPTKECFDLSMQLGGEQRFPLIVFMTGRLTNYRWLTFCEALGYKPNWNPAGNTYRITDERLAGSAYADQETLIRHVVGADLGPVGESTFSNDLFQDPVEELVETEEGRRVLRLHLVRERSLALVRSFKRTLRNFRCSVCGFDFEQVYGEIGRDFIEAHHTKPVASLEENERVTVEDLLAVCSNCHRMLHRRMPLLTADELKAHLAEAYRKRSERA